PNAFEDSLALLSSGKLNVEALMSHELDYKTVDDFVNGKLGVVSKAVVKVGGEEA
ncbi:MAG: alcohol dehydrogenase, partial [Leuconostoc mesenteroides]